MHVWDIFADSLIPKWSFGFSTLTAYPDADPETTTVDGHVRRDTGTETWATIHDGAGTAFSDNATTAQFASVVSSTTANRWDVIRRGIFLFDTSSITASATISAVVFSLWATSVTNDFTSSLCVVSSNPASNTGLANSDYATLGTTQYASDTALSGITTGAYTDISLNATGIAAVSKTGVTKLGTLISQDRTNTEPTWASALQSNVTGRYAEINGADTSNDPKLVVTYSIPLPVPASTPSIPSYIFQLKDQVIGY